MVDMSDKVGIVDHIEDKVNKVFIVDLVNDLDMVEQVDLESSSSDMCKPSPLSAFVYSSVEILKYRNYIVQLGQG